MKDNKTIILAIESSCDETSVAVMADGREILSNIISSQIEIHKLYGGVVPEIASRHHLENINAVIEQAMTEADITSDDIDAIGVTYGPGLVGALLIGIAAAKALALAQVAGATADNIYKWKKDYDDGRWIYEGKIVYNGWEYEFEMDASTGAFLEWDIGSVFD